MKLSLTARDLNMYLKRPNTFIFLTILGECLVCQLSKNKDGLVLKMNVFVSSGAVISAFFRFAGAVEIGKLVR